MARFSATDGGSAGLLEASAGQSPGLPREGAGRRGLVRSMGRLQPGPSFTPGRILGTGRGPAWVSVLGPDAAHPVGDSTRQSLGGPVGSWAEPVPSSLPHSQRHCHGNPRLDAAPLFATTRNALTLTRPRMPLQAVSQASVFTVISGTFRRHLKPHCARRAEAQ